MAQNFDYYSEKGVRISLGCFFQGIVGSDRQVRCKSAFYHLFEHLFLFYRSTKCFNMDRLLGPISPQILNSEVVGLDPILDKNP
ncbi:MAG: hypothetical protein AMJ56_15635 [Anaerolineae bacterium SG8_19]|nr:MAG: hypothetical protein AMJ56_15635 [Anaerolineae bacterium SG8_19]